MSPLSPEDDRDQDVGGTQPGDDKSGKHANSPVEHQEIPILLVRYGESFPETPDGSSESNNRNCSERQQEYQIQTAHAEIYETLAPDPSRHKREDRRASGVDLRARVVDELQLNRAVGILIKIGQTRSG